MAVGRFEFISISRHLMFLLLWESRSWQSVRTFLVFIEWNEIGIRNDSSFQTTANGLNLKDYSVYFISQAKGISVYTGKMVEK